MKILHTADIHLIETENERWEALLEIIKLSDIEKIDALLISGDLFDKDVDAEKLRVKIRDIFSGRNYRIIVLPGNHDFKSFRSGNFYGQNIEVIHSLDNVIETEDANIVGFPYEEIRESEIYSRLKSISDMLNSNKYNILLYHGELLDSFYSRKDFGEEGEKRYMPIRLDYLKEMNFHYVLAGHFHSNFRIWEFSNKHYFVYPGSPTPITIRETGRRKVNLFNLGEAPKEKILNTTFYEDLKIKLDPFSDLDPVTVINNELSRTDQNARIFLTVGGYINKAGHGIDESMLNERIEGIAKENENIKINKLEFRDLCETLSDDLFETFTDKLNSMNLDESRSSGIKDLLIRAMIEAGL
ncbi:MAG: DNA repair exonuclease [Spirochaetota bacterium]|nr:DNA repair exonuclease [Spirochaetota bacterium]